MKIKDTSVNDVLIIEAEPFIDHRGSFTRMFCADELDTVLKHRKIVQVNHSATNIAGAIRGLHFQNAPHEEMKFVRCINGQVFDVVVDIRPDSSTYLKYHAEELSPGNAKMIVVPEGCAHGIQALEANSELMYLVTSFYQKSAEGCVRYNDPAIAIKWPMPVTDVSERDRTTPLIEQAEKISSEKTL